MRLKGPKRGIAALVAVFAAVSAHAELKIAVVNYARLVEESPQAKTALEAMRSEFQPRQRELEQREKALKANQEKLQKDGDTMSPEQRSSAEKELRDGIRDLNQRRNEVQEAFNGRRNDTMARLQKTLSEEVIAYAKAQGLDLVMAEGVIYAAPALDITPVILRALQAKPAKPAAGATPPAAPKPAPKP